MRGLQAAGGTPLSEEDGARPVPARRIRILVGVAVLVYVLDLLSKIAVVAWLEQKAPVEVIPGVLVLNVIRNPGAAFSIGTGMTIIFTLIAAVVVFAIIRTARKLRSLPWAIDLGLLLGGASGNLTDRIFRSPAPLQGHVVDFIQAFPVTGFPIFNIADSAVVCGGILAVFLAWRGYQIDGTRQTGDSRPGDSRDAAGTNEASENTGDRNTGERTDG